MAADRQMFSLIRDISRMLRCFRQDETFCEGVTFAQFVILDEVAERGRMGQSELNRVLEVDKSTTTRLIRPLLEKGLVVRRRSRRDARAAELELTEQGRGIHSRVWSCLSEFMKAVRSQLPEKNRDDVCDSVRLFLDALERTYELKACAASCCAGGENGDG